MKPLVFIDILAALAVLLGFQLAFRQRALRGWAARRSREGPAPSDPASSDHKEFDAVLRMVGVMIIAFSVTGCAFANLIAYYGRHATN